MRIWSEARFRRRPGGLPLIIGHRGVGAAAAEDGASLGGPATVPPENTLAAFEEAARQGADAIELDARTCASGELVVLHDANLRRSTGGADERAVDALPWDELRRVDVGGERVPLLAGALAMARARRLAVNVEMKGDVADRLAMVRATARLLRGWDPAHAVLVSSFDPAMLAALGAIAPRVPRALLVQRTRWHEAAVRAAPALGVVGVHLQRTITPAGLIEALRRQGRLVNVWTVNDPREACDLAALGVDGIVTDAPAKIRAALEAAPCA